MGDRDFPGSPGWYGSCDGLLTRNAACLSLVLAAALGLTACGADDATVGGPGADLPAEISQERVAGVTYGAHLEPAGLDHYIRWSKKVGQGAQPAGEVAFKNLQALGYKTVMSVDGAVPEVELAAKYGLRYVHVPIGYDGITKDQALRIVKATRISKFPIFVHCHHGVHRGPAAAQVCRIVEDGISNEQAVAGLRTSGTNPNYKGLWRDVRGFVTPTDAELAEVSADLPSTVLPKGLRAGMVDVSHRWEFVKLSKAARWKVPEGHPDVDPAHEARMLWELLREMGRNDSECREQGEIFLKYLAASEGEVIELEKAIRAGDVEKADAQYKAIKQLCGDCHRDYRN